MIAQTKFDLNPETIFVQGGTFKMGCTNEQRSDCFEHEKPTHEVILNDFNIGKFEVTVEQYLQFVNSTKTHFPLWLEKGNEYNIKTGTNEYYKSRGYKRLGNVKLPIVGVSWNDAVAYCVWLTKKTDTKFRLPTEAEWEYAARGGVKSGSYKYSGSNNADEVSWYFGNSLCKTHEVGTRTANELDIYDMSGNVWEWCSDWYGDYSDSPVEADNSTGPSSGSSRILRGGGWNNFPRHCRVAYRHYSAPTNCDNDIGFRVVFDSQ